MDNYYKVLYEALKEDDVIRKTIVKSGKEALFQNEKMLFGDLEEDWDRAELTELIKAEPHIVLFGAGHIAKAIHDIASLMGMRITVLDEREEVANKERFPNAEIIVRSYEEMFDHDYHFYRPYFIILTHGHRADKDALRYCINKDYSYLGMIGSKGKVAKTFEDLIDEGIEKEKLLSVHAPIGIKIGAVTPEEIAISITAEIISIFRDNKQTVTLDPAYLEKASSMSGISVRIIDKKGSAPRAIGSEMFVTENSFIGTIGGGAIEHESIKEARRMLKEGEKSKVIDHKLSTKGDLGMICGGDVTLLFQSRASFLA